MVNVCASPMCKSHAGIKRLFKFPKDASRREAWSRAINRKGFVPTQYSYLCIDHFAQQDIKYIKNIENKDGSNTKYEYKQIKLTDSAVPCIFPNQPKYFTKNVPKLRYGVERRERVKIAKAKEIEKRDNIYSFQHFCDNFSKNLDLL